MIEHRLWLSDPRFQRDCIMQERVQPWSSQLKPSEIYVGFSILSVADGYRVIYTVASKSKSAATHAEILKNIATLIRIGRFWLKRILYEVPHPVQKIHLSQQRPQLKL